MLGVHDIIILDGCLKLLESYENDTIKCGYEGDIGLYSRY